MIEITIREHTGPLPTIETGDILCDVMCNGFSIRETILESIREYEKKYILSAVDGFIEQLANYITKGISDKLRLKQGLVRIKEIE
jgi:hypothetical protein